MSSIAVKVENLSKRYLLGAVQERHDTFREQLVAGARSLFHRNGRRAAAPEDNSFWALNDVSFEVREGEVVGIIGRNGAGKSTLLKILSRITEPTAGRAIIRGRVGSLLEVGTGFHQELTGRENIYLNGAILGMKKSEIDRKFDEIVDFSGVEKFIDTPVKRYSSGMYVRLAFAVAAYLEPDVLIIDEVLAVGDAGFQSKCLGRMGQVAREGRTVLFVSHNMAAVENLCSKVLLLQNGKTEFLGRTREAIDYYLRNSSGSEVSRSNVVSLVKASGRPDMCRPLLTRLELFTDDEKSVDGGVKMGGRLKAYIYFNLEEATSRVDAALAFDNLYGQRIFTAHSLFEPNRSHEVRVGEQVFICDIPNLNLVPGEYKVKVALDIDNVDADLVEDAARLTVVESDYYGTGKVPWNGVLVLKHNWYLGRNCGNRAAGGLEVE
jgi:lipopolysaccharide transport system ATP-binding protein